MNLSPKLKKAISTALFSVAGAAIVTAGTYIPGLPVALQAIAGAALVGLGHVLNAWGTEEGVEARVEERAITKTAAALDVAFGPADDPHGH